MAIAAIFISVIAAIILLLSAVLSFIAKEYVMGFCMLILLGIDVFLMVLCVRKYNNESPKAHVIEDVVEYKIDSITTIAGSDTTKVYTITYVK